MYIKIGHVSQVTLLLSLPEDATDSHEEPEVSVGQVVEAGNDGQLSGHQHQGDEQGAGVQVIVECQGPDVPIHSRHNLQQHKSSSTTIVIFWSPVLDIGKYLLCEDGEQRHKK